MSVSTEEEVTEMLVDKRDAALKTSVLRELRWDARVNETEIGVAVADGVVTLTGRVDSEAEKLAAQEAAHRAAGVLDVANDIMIKVPFALGRDDTDLAQAVRDSLEREADVPAEHIHSSVYDAVVTLSGVVDTEHASDVAERAVHRVAGVRRVVNKLVVVGGTVNLAALRRSIESALERRAQREAGHIELSAHDGVVVLEGRVNSFSDKSVVLDLVRHAPAVRGIDDRLRIEP
jgi:osmotically-inducible protein OsmY